MAAIAHTHALPNIQAAAANDLVNRIGSAFAAIRNFLLRGSDYNRTVRELSALSDRQLSDIGIERGDIGRIAREMSERA